MRVCHLKLSVIIDATKYIGYFFGRNVYANVFIHNYKICLRKAVQRRRRRPGGQWGRVIRTVLMTLPHSSNSMPVDGETDIAVANSNERFGIIRTFELYAALY